MPEGWIIYSLYKDDNGDKRWHISFAYYTGNRHPSGFGWESKDNHTLILSEEELIKVLLKKKAEDDNYGHVIHECQSEKLSAV